MDALALLAVMALVLVLSVLVTIAVAGLLTRRHLRQRNQVDPTAVEDAPLRWSCSPFAAARLHRRLIAAAAVARLSEQRSERHDSSGPDRLDQLARSVRAEVVATDARLIRSSELRGGPRRRAVGHLAGEVRAVEHAASSWFSVARASDTRTGRAGDPVGLETVQAELDLLAEALCELEDLDRDAGLVNDPANDTANDTATSPAPENRSGASGRRPRGGHQPVERPGGGTAVE